MDNIKVSGYDFFFWEYEEQTKMKHTVLNDYLGIWMQKLGSFNNVNYFDCHGGCGAYIDKQGVIYFGSPILASQLYEKNKGKLKNKVQICIIEKEKENIENLKKVFKYNNIEIKPIMIHGDFNEEINKILDNKKDKINPTFFFVDPFGFKLKISTIERLMKIPRCEVFANFMFTQLNRFLIDSMEDNLNQLFGCNDWKSFCDLSGDIREENIVGLFKSQAKKFSKYVFPYRMSFEDKDRTYYYLIHLTNNLDGCRIMKSSFAKHNYGRVEYLGINNGVLTLFDLKEVKIEEVKQFLLGKYSGANQELTFDMVIEQNIDEVPYLESEFRTALQELRKEKTVKVKPVTSRTDRGLKGNDIIAF